MSIKREKTPIVLYIDTSSNKELCVSLRVGEKSYTVKKKIGVRKSQAVLSVIDQLLQRHTLTKDMLNAVEVHPGPGSFTGLRVGIAIANTISYVLQIPVNNSMKIVEPVYE